MRAIILSPVQYYWSKSTAWSQSRRAEQRSAFRGERGIWQRRYWEHTIRDQRDFARHFDHIHFNPIKHGLVEHPADWPYSTFRR